MAQPPNPAADKARKKIEAKLKAASNKADSPKIDAVIKEAKVLKGDKDMPD